MKLLLLIITAVSFVSCSDNPCESGGVVFGKYAVERSPVVPVYSADGKEYRGFHNIEVTEYYIKVQGEKTKFIVNVSYEEYNQVQDGWHYRDLKFFKPEVEGK